MPGKPWTVGQPKPCHQTSVKEKHIFKDHNELFHRRQWCKGMKKRCERPFTWTSGQDKDDGSPSF